jgi:hypothetical protein
MVVLCEGLGVEKPRLDFPQSVVAEVAGAFDRSAMHQATPVAVVFIDISHFLFALAGETRLGVPQYLASFGSPWRS